MLKQILVLAFVLAGVLPAHAGVVGWITAKERSWRYIQQTGGLRIQPPTLRDGKIVLPVDYDATGVSGVTTRPTVMNSGLAVRRVAVRRESNQRLVLTLVTQLVEETSSPGRTHYGDLSDIPTGIYDVYYEDAGDADKFLGKVNVP